MYFAIIISNVVKKKQDPSLIKQKTFEKNIDLFNCTRISMVFTLDREVPKHSQRTVIFSFHLLPHTCNFLMK